LIGKNCNITGPWIVALTLLWKAANIRATHNWLRIVLLCALHYRFSGKQSLKQWIETTITTKVRVPLTLLSKVTFESCIKKLQESHILAKFRTGSHTVRLFGGLSNFIGYGRKAATQAVVVPILPFLTAAALLPLCLAFACSSQRGGGSGRDKSLFSRNGLNAMHLYPTVPLVLR